MNDDYWAAFQYGTDPTLTQKVACSLEVKEAGMPAKTGPSRNEILAMAGTRVAFRQNLEAALTYPKVPGPSIPGTVVTVRTAGGDTTTHDGRVFVAWEDGSFGSYLPEHLRIVSEKWAVRQASQQAVLIRLAGGMDLTDFLKVGSTDLVHKATRDLWSVRQGEHGAEIVRLFNDNGQPIKA